MRTGPGVGPSVPLPAPSPSEIHITRLAVEPRAKSPSVGVERDHVSADQTMLDPELLGDIGDVAEGDER